MDLPLLELALQIEAADSWHAYIQDDASWRVCQRGAHEILRRSEGPHVKSDRTDQAAEAFANARVVVDDVNHARLCLRHFSDRLPRRQGELERCARPLVGG